MVIDPTTTAMVAAFSAAVSTTTTLILQTVFTKRIEHHFARQLEEYKTTLSAKLSAEQGIVTRRLEAFPKIVELIYRTRNMARDILSAPSPALLEELRSRARELEDFVFRFRIDLEADHVFVMVHRYKNLVLQFAREAGDIQGGDSSQSLRALFDQIETTHTDVVHRLSEDTATVGSGAA